MFDSNASRLRTASCNGTAPALRGGAALMLLLAVVSVLGGCRQAEDDPAMVPGTINGVPAMTPPPAGAPGTPAPVPGAPGAVGATPPPAGSAVPVPPPAGQDPDNPGQAGAPAEPPSAEMPAAGSGADPMETAGSEAPPPPARMDLGKGDGKDVITIGDSWMTLYSGGIEGALDRAGTSYRHFGIAGTTLIGGDIPLQYGRAKAGGADIKTVIMTGGGNDIMFTGGCNTTEACTMSVAAIRDALNELWTTMAADGVKDVIYVNYSADAGTTPQNTRPTTPPDPPAICLTGMIVCHTLPTTDLVMGQLVDGIHPSGAAHDRIAMALLAMMEKEGMRR